MLISCEEDLITPSWLTVSLHVAMEFVSSLAKSNIVFETEVKLVKKNIFPRTVEALFVTLSL